MLRDPQEHQLKGSGQWEYLNLLGVALVGEAREVPMYSWTNVTIRIIATLIIDVRGELSAHECCGEPIVDIVHPTHSTAESTKTFTIHVQPASSLAGLRDLHSESFAS